MPAAAVIPAPIAYIKVVAVKKLVVGFLARWTSLPTGLEFGLALPYSWHTLLHLIVQSGTQDIYFEEIRVFQAGTCLEYISME